jgi:predicted metal-dependent peptidase
METQTEISTQDDSNIPDYKKAYEDTVITLISRNPFYAHILLQLKVNFVKDFPTLGVEIKDSQVNLIIGIDFFVKATIDQRVFFLMHEMAHIILGHLGIERRGNPKDARIMNIAMDTAIHEILTQSKTLFDKDSPIKPFTVESIRELTKNNSIKNNETTEYYFNFLKTLKDEMIEQMKDLDQHDFMEGEGEEGNSIDIGKAITMGLLEKASRQVGAGKTPSDALLTIEKFKKSTKNWKAILRRYTTSVVDSDVRMTRNKRHKRYGFLVAGRKKTFNPRVVCIVDTSGSMDSKRLDSAFAELVRMEKQGYEIVLIEADAKVQKVREFSSRKDIKFNGGGGTLYQAALDEASKHRPDICIYLTDLDPADRPLKPRFPVIWAAVANGGYKPDFGVIVEIGDD